MGSALGRRAWRIHFFRRSSGLYEVRVQGGGKNHRLFCMLLRDATDLGGPSLVCLGGLSKPRRQAADPKDYKRILKYRSEFLKHRTVLS